MRPTRDYSRILDYSHYVEVIDEEEEGCGRFYPTGLIERADQLGAPGDGVFRFFPGDLGPQISAYYSERLAVFGHCKPFTCCPYCTIPLVAVHKADRKHNSIFGSVLVSACPECGWWESLDEATLELGEGSWYKSQTYRRRSLLREFSVGGSETPIHLLHKHLAKHREAMYFISPSNLEHLVGRVFAEFMSCEAIHLGGPNDGGIDLVLVRGDRDFVVQVKRRADPNSAEAVSGIREFIGAMLLAGSSHGLFVTTAPRFSASATETAAAASSGKIVAEIELINGQKLFDVCGLTVPSDAQPWRKFAFDAAKPPPASEPIAYFAFPVVR